MRSILIELIVLATTMVTQGIVSADDGANLDPGTRFIDLPLALLLKPIGDNFPVNMDVNLSQLLVAVVNEFMRCFTWNNDDLPGMCLES